jgi:hypothetical protein
LYHGEIGAGKICTGCGEWKEWEAFSKDKTRGDGRQHRCRVCFARYHEENRDSIIEKQARYRAEHKDRERERKVRYQAENNDRLREYRARYNQENRDNIRECKARYRAENRDIVREKQARYREEHRDSINKKAVRYNAFRRSRSGSFTLEDLDRMVEEQNFRCFYCRMLLIDSHLEHKLPLCRGGTNDPSNLCMSCAACNLHKHAKTAEEFVVSPWFLARVKAVELRGS